MEGLIGLFFVIIIIFVIVKVVQSKNNVDKNSNEYKTSTYSSNKASTQNEYAFSKEELFSKAKEKFNKISKNKKDKFLQDRKSFLKKLYITLGIIFSVISFTGILGCTGNNNLKGLPIIIIFAILGITMFIMFAVNIKKSDEELILCQIYKELKKIYSQMNNDRIYQYKDYVKKHSLMYKAIRELNSKYNFDRNICKQHCYNEYLNSKSQFDNFNYEKWIMQKINENSSLFSKFENTYKENVTRYKEYANLYTKLEKYREEIEIEDLEIDFETFNIIEKKIFIEEKQPPIDEPNVQVEYSYRSPSGRNYYHNSYTFSYYQILKLIKSKKEQEILEQEEFEKKQKALEEKKEKERKLRELDKIEKQVLKEKEKLSKDKQEFEQATKGHIYSSQPTESEKATSEIIIEDSDEPYVKLKKLKQMFDNGQITFEEYSNKKKELL